jgi:hypothetical protein
MSIHCRTYRLETGESGSWVVAGLDLDASSDWGELKVGERQGLSRTHSFAGLVLVFFLLLLLQ